MSRTRVLLRLLLAGALLLAPAATRGVVLWSDLGTTLALNTGDSKDILGKAFSRDNTASDTLYFKFHIDPLSDTSTEEYLAAFQFYWSGAERLGIGNALKAWAYSAFNTATTGEFNRVFGDLDLRSARPESSGPGVFLPYELPRRGIEVTVVVKVQYVPAGDDLITVWLNPDLGAGATELSQPVELTTTFSADASFDEIRLRHVGGGRGWAFSDLAIATSFADFVVGGSNENGPAGTHQFAVRTWQREEGLPQDAVHSLAQTREGYLWIGGEEGLTRFDGLRFTSFDRRDGLPDGRVQALQEDALGHLWIGTAGGGLARKQGTQFHRYSLSNGLPSDVIQALALDENGQLWVGTAKGISVWNGAQFTAISGLGRLDGQPITCLYPRSGTMWIGVRGIGAFRYARGDLTALPNPPVENALQDVHCILEDRLGRVWIGAGEDLVLCREANEWRQYRIPRHLARRNVTALAEQNDGTIWAGSLNEGLFRFSAGVPTAVTASSGLSDNNVYSLLVDRDGNLWVGTGSGLNYFRRKRVVTLGTGEGLGYGAVRGMAEVSPGVILAAKPDDGVYRWDGRMFAREQTAEWWRNYPDVSSILNAPDGTWWVGGSQGLMSLPRPGAKAPGAGMLVLSNQHVLALAHGKTGGLWIGTKAGQIWSLQNGSLIGRTNWFQSHPITALIARADGSLWVSTDGGGLQICEQDHPSRPALDSDGPRNLATLHHDGEGRLWMGTMGSGLALWHSGKLTLFTTREGLPDNTISQIVEDSGRLWLGSNRGLACARKADLQSIADGKSAMIYPQVFGRAQGLRSEQCTGGYFPAGLKTSSGWLWFATTRGIVAVDPRPETERPLPQIVVLEEVLVEGNEPRSPQPDPAGGVNTEHRLELRPGQSRVEIRFTGINFRAPEQVRFRYRLEGLEGDWVEAGNRRVASYGYVPPGDYRFRVMACNEEGVWGETEATLRLFVLPRFWQSRWFLGLAAIGVLLSVAGTARIIEKRKLHNRLKQLENERALQRERARIAQDLHDELGSSLTRISLLSDLVKADKTEPQQVEAHAQKLAQSATQTVRSLEEIVWALKPGSDTLHSLIQYIAHFANELFESQSARCRLDLPHDLPDCPLPPEMRHNIFLIVKEALTNALKHANASEVLVQASLSGQRLEVAVQDNGIGFEGTGGGTPGRRNGLGNMHGRAATMNGDLDVRSRPGSGTRVLLAVNLPT